MSLRRLLFASFIIALCAPFFARAADEPRIGDERIVLHTIGGDVVLALYPDVAPETCKQILALVKLGVYDTTYFHRCEPNFVLQLSTPDFRALPMTDAQRAAIHKIKAEFSDIPHTRGVLSMARQDNDKNSAETSFSILLGNAPHLDHQYTIFGRVEKGMDTVDGLVRVPRKKGTTEPVVKLLLGRAEVVDSKKLATMDLRGPEPILVPNSAELDGPMVATEGLTSWRHSQLLVLSGLALVVVIGLLGFLLASKVSQRTLLFVNLLNIVVGGGLLFLLLTASGRAMVNLDGSSGEELGEILNDSTRAALLGMAGVIVVALLGVILTRATPKMVSSLNLINVLIGGFLLFAMIVPTTQTSTTLAAGVFLAIVSMFKLMGQFEAN